MATFAYRTLQREGRTVVLFLHTGSEPDQPTWDAAMAETAKFAENGDLTKFGYLVITDGGAPNTKQRQALAAATRERSYPIAVVNSSPIIRGVITAISWINRAIRPFSPQQMGEAIAYVGWRAADLPAVLADMRALQRELGAPIACLDAAEGQKQREANAR